MAHTSEARQRARASIYQLESRLHLLRLNWRRLAEKAAIQRFPNRWDNPRYCCFGIGKSKETKALRAAFDEEIERLRPIHGPMIVKLETKIERTRRFFGFND